MCNRYVINIVKFHPNPNLNLTQDIYIYNTHTCRIFVVF